MPYATAGIYDVTIVVTDAHGAVATTSFASVIVYDTNAAASPAAAGSPPRPAKRRK